MLGDRALRVRQPHPLVFLLAADVDPAQPCVDSRRGAGLLAGTTGLLDRMGWLLRARALLRERRAAHTRQGDDARRPPLGHCLTPCMPRAAPASRALIPRSRHSRARHAPAAL